MSTHIYPSKKYKGIFFVNGKTMSLSDFRINKFHSLTSVELQDFTNYLIADKLI